MIMTHPPRFLQTILASPEADAPRLQYANWLEGCGNPMGEFIRLQCLLAQRPVGEPSLYFERRAQGLLAEFQACWSGFLAGRVEWCSFRRGFIEEISLTETQWIKHAEDLFRLAPVIDVHLMTGAGRLDALPELPFLKHTFFLDLSAQAIGDEGVERLAESPLLAQVHGLNLGCCHLDDAGLDALIDAPDLGALRELYLNDNPISDDSMRRFVLTPLVEQLDFLDVRHTLISQEGIDTLKHILGSRVLASESHYIVR
jgi:uncharacterized protein (TIGR02996 family)